MKWDSKFVKFIDKIKPWQAFLVFLVIGFSVFFTGLNGGFQGDDTDQILKNEAVHSISNVGQFFRSSTFWNGETLVGDFYRPTMTTTYSLIYTFFGENPIAYHVFQLLLYISCAFILFLFLKSFFKPALAMFLSLIFLIHPINSQIVYSIPSMQEPLMFIFGISALYVLSRSQTTKSLAVATVLLFMSLMSKETAIVFVCAAVIYELLFHKKQLKTFIKIIVLPVILYILIRISVVGFRNIAQSAPVDFLSFGERMIMVPSMILFYITKFLFPQDLATSYYWTHQTFSFEGFWIPLIIVLLIIALIIWLGFAIYKKAGKKTLFTYLFFTAWLVLGVAPHLQIIALDMTACETWFVSMIVGAVGMIAVSVKTFLPKIRPVYLLIVGILILLPLGIRSNLRGNDYHSQETLSLRDIKVTEKNYLAMNNLAKFYINTDRPEKAEWYAKKSIEFFPAVSNYNNLGVIKQKLNDFQGAKEAYSKALNLVPLRVTYENVAIANFVVGNSKDNIAFLKEGLALYPTNGRLWTYLAIEYAAVGNAEDAKNAIVNAYNNNVVQPDLYNSIIHSLPLDIPMPDTNKVIQIRWN